MPVLVLVVAGCCCLAEAQTDRLLGPSISPPALQLRALAGQPEGHAQTVVALEDETSCLRITETLQDQNTSALTLDEMGTPPVVELSLSSRLTEREMQVYRRLDEAGYLRPPEPETPLSHFLDGTFSPEVIHLGKGKAVAGCTLYTAIKRRNPLCLLNPLVLFFSW